MNIDIICISNKQNDWVSEGYKNYLNRLPKWLAVNVLLVTPIKDRSNKVSKLEKEARKIRKKIKNNDYLVILDTEGLPLDNSDLLREFKELMNQGKSIKVVIGGSDGVDDSLKADAHTVWSMSKLIYPHALCLLMFVEQLYRTTSILSNHPYHKY